MPTVYASIALPLPVAGPFTYRVPDALLPLAEAGRRALVPFGQRMLTGFIIGVTEEPGDVPEEKIRDVRDIPDDERMFDPHMLDLARWAADYYLCSPGEALRTALPAGSLVRSRIRVHPGDMPPAGQLAGRQDELAAYLLAHGPALLRTLQTALGAWVPATIRALERKGVVRLEHELSTPAARVKTERHVRAVPDTEIALPPRARKQADCLAALRKYPEGIPVAEFTERHGFSRGVINALTDAGLAEYSAVEVVRNSKMLDQEPVRADHPLTPAQEECLRLIGEESRAKNPRPALLQGVTGSGKTRVYIELVRRALAEERGAIILVPEIALTPQTVRFFTSVFPGRVAALHSAMSPGERFDMWRLIHAGSRDVVIGPRSAVFAPLANPGIIIVDEEHDHSYKQTDTAPRYHARDVAVVRGNLLGIPVVLGSATPSLESWHNAVTGKYLHVRLPERIDSRPLPEVTLVDMRAERERGNNSSLSVLLREELSSRIERGEKSIVLINRRGFATGIRCRHCGYTLSCPHCSAGLVYHVSRRLAVCHLCGFEQIVLQHCPNCGAEDLNYTGRGTQRIEQELSAVFGDTGIVRMDADTTRTHDSHFRLLEEFRAGGASILLGTQMVGKGLDIAEVTLVGVIAADSALAIPDFRAAERTFQLVTQVAGRAGRGNVPGRVVVQALMPDHYAVAAACRHDYDSFAATEIELRREVDFPPFTRLILLEFTGENADAVMARAQDTAALITEHAPAETGVLGPVEAPIARVRGRHRAHLLLKTRRITALRTLVRHVLDTFAGPEDVTADVDPVELM